MKFPRNSQKFQRSNEHSDVDLTVKDICENSVSGKIKKILAKYFISNHQKFSFLKSPRNKNGTGMAKNDRQKLSKKKHSKMAVEKLPENGG